ncbi:MAG: HAMP domain-containing sensor histidine kinase [Anaerolineaceae bacterium]|nr:HAMP domain-containing sensor histidine kinase [Anaerolineaceae bacterium]
MRQSLRLRLLISHVLPLFLLIPLIGLSLIYVLESRLIIPTLANELIDQGILIGKLIQSNPQVWVDAGQAGSFVNSLGIRRPTDILLLDRQDHLIASSSPADSSEIGKVDAGLADAASRGSIGWYVSNDLFSSQSILEIDVPITDRLGNLIGSVRLVRRLASLAEVLEQARLIILVVLFAGLMINTLVGLILAETTSKPLRDLANEIVKAPLKGEVTPLPEVGVEEIRSLTAAFNRLQERRFQLEADRERMLANLVHEMGRPLGSLKAALQSLLSGADQDTGFRRELMEGMQDRIDRMGRLIDDLVVSYQQSQNQMSIQKRPVEFVTWIHRQIILWVETARQKGIHWHDDIPADMPDILVDPDRLAQALSNLVENALKFTPPGGSVSLKAGTNENEFWLQVSDTGPGIDPLEQTQIYEPFYRAVRPPWKTPGLGLGLSIARTIVQAHAGHIELESDPGQGSTFTIYIPLPSEPVSAPMDTSYS